MLRNEKSDVCSRRKICLVALSSATLRATSDFWPQRCSVTLVEGEKTDVFDIISKALLVNFYEDISLFEHLNMCHRALGEQCFFIDHVTHFSTARSTSFDDIARCARRTCLLDTSHRAASQEIG